MYVRACVHACAHTYMGRYARAGAGVDPDDHGQGSDMFSSEEENPNAPSNMKEVLEPFVAAQLCDADVGGFNKGQPVSPIFMAVN